MAGTSVEKKKPKRDNKGSRDTYVVKKPLGTYRAFSKEDIMILRAGLIKTSTPAK